jgi:hypothetical protein
VLQDVKLGIVGERQVMAAGSILDAGSPNMLSCGMPYYRE